jgi:hypothetical protein
VTDLLAGAARDCDALSHYLKSPEGQRRLTAATRCHLQAAVIALKLKAARTAIVDEVTGGKLVSLKTWEQLMQILVEELGPPAFEALVARLRPRLKEAGCQESRRTESATE